MKLYCYKRNIVINVIVINGVECIFEIKHSQLGLEALLHEKKVPLVIDLWYSYLIADAALSEKIISEHSFGLRP